MADERRAMGSRTGDSKKDVECGICINPPYKARRDYMKATHFPLKHPSTHCKEKGDQTLGSLPKFNLYQPPRQPAPAPPPPPPAPAPLPVEEGMELDEAVAGSFQIGFGTYSIFVF